MHRINAYRDGKIPSNETSIPDPRNPTKWADGYDYGNDNVDWLRAIFKAQQFSQEHNVSVTGGNEKLNFYASANYLGQNGLLNIGNDNYKRYTATANVNAQLSKWADLAINLRYTREDYNKPSAYNDGMFFDIMRQSWPTMPLYDPNGYLFSAPSQALPLAEGGTEKRQNDIWAYQLQLILKPIERWNIYVNLNYRTNDRFVHRDELLTYNHDVSGAPYLVDNTSLVRESANRTNFFSPNIYSEYSFSLQEHNMKAMVGYQSELNLYRDLSADRAGIIVPSSPVINIASGTDINGNPVTPGVSGQYTDWATVGFFGRINYDFANRYLLEVNLRYDGTSRFRADKRWNWFPSVSVGWNVAQEAFWQPIRDYVNQFKLRGSYGLLGNQNTSGLYPTYQTMGYGTANGGWLINGMRPNTSSAPALISTSMTWERIRSWNAGVDFGLLDNRLTGSFEMFTRFTEDMIGPAPALPTILGTAPPRMNNTDLKTYGFELQLGWRDRLSNGLGYNVRFMLSDSQTKITNYPNPTNSLGTYRTDGLMGEIWGYTTIDIARNDEQMEAHLASLPNGGQNALGNNWKAGDIMYKDLNDDGRINNGANTLDDHGDLSVIGNSTPRYAFSIDLSADWKGFDFRAFFQGIGKKDFWFSDNSSFLFWGTSPWGMWFSNGYKPQEDYFRNDPENPLGVNINSYYPRPLFNGKNQQTQTKYLQDASYIRLKNLQLGYTLPADLTKKIGIQKLRVYLSGENLLTFSGINEMYDPETIDGGWATMYPMSRVFSVGLNINL
jgi:TonB-linked SusC/RagA family outer membrane protein